jgi:hypothetical protein
MYSSSEDPYARPGRMANLVKAAKTARNENDAQRDVDNVNAVNSAKRVRPKAVKAARYKRKGI